MQRELWGVEHKRAEGRDRDTRKRARGWGRAVPHPLSGIYRIHMSGVTCYITQIERGWWVQKQKGRKVRRMISQKRHRG